MTILILEFPTMVWMASNKIGFGASVRGDGALFIAVKSSPSATPTAKKGYIDPAEVFENVQCQNVP